MHKEMADKIQNTDKRGSEKFRKEIFMTLFISICFHLFLSISAFSQVDSLSSYLEIAARNNPVVLQKFTDYQIALQKVPQVGTLPDPELSLGVFLKPMELISGNQVADITLMQMFPWFGVLRYSKDEMSLMANAKFELFREAKLQVYYELQKTWFELYKVQKAISISEKNIEILKTLERLALVRLSATPLNSTGNNKSGEMNPAVSSQSESYGTSGMQGMGGNQSTTEKTTTTQSATTMPSGSMETTNGGLGLAEIYRIQIEAGDLENSIALLKNKKNVIIAQFNSLMNRPMSSPVSVPDTLFIDSLEITLSSVSDSILEKNPMIDMLEYEKKSIEARGKMISRMGYPMLGLGINYSLISKTTNGMAEPGMNGEDMIMPMVTISLPIYRKKYNAMSSENKLLNEGVMYNYQSTVNSLQTEYYQAILLYEDAQRRINLYDNQYKLAYRSFNLMLKSFSVSTSDLTDVLRVQQQTLDYELKQIEAVADLNISIAWLKRLGNFGM